MRISVALVMADAGACPYLGVVVTGGNQCNYRGCVYYGVRWGLMSREPVPANSTPSGCRWLHGLGPNSRAAA